MKFVMELEAKKGICYVAKTYVLKFRFDQYNLRFGFYKKIIKLKDKMCFKFPNLSFHLKVVIKYAIGSSWRL